MQITKPSVLYYSFVLHPGLGNPAAREYLRERWAGVAELGITKQCDGLVDARFPSSFAAHSHAFRALAFAEGECGTPDGFAAAYIFEYLDIAGIAVMLSPNDADRGMEGWSELSTALRKHWPVAPSVPAYVLGEVCFAYALYSPGALDVHGASAAVASHAPEGPYSASCCVPVNNSEAPICLWDLGRRGSSRVLAALAPEDQDAAVSRSVFWTPRRSSCPTAWPDDRLPPAFLRCLLHAARIEHAWRLYHEQMPTVRQHSECVDSAVTEIARLHADMMAAEIANADALIRAHCALSRLQSEAGGVLVSQAQLKDLVRSMRIAQQNLEGAVNRAGADELPCGQGLFRRDLERAGWLQRQGEHDIGYLATARERAREVHEMTHLLLERARYACDKRMEQQLAELEQARRAKESSEEDARRAEMARAADTERRQRQMDVLQTIVLGSLLVCLDAMHAFGTHLPLARPLHWPLIATLMSFALFLPLMIVHWHQGYGAVDRIAAALSGGCVAWFTAAFVYHSQTTSWLGQGWIAAAFTGGALVGLVAFVLATVLAKRGREPATVCDVPG